MFTLFKEILFSFNFDYDYRGIHLKKLQTIKYFFTNLGFRTVVLYRISRVLKLRGGIFKKISNRILFNLSAKPGVEINTKYDIGKGLIIHHPHDIVIGGEVAIGEYVTIYNGVTLGASNKSTENQKYPIIGDSVIIYTGAKIIGPITIGANSIVGANAVVTKSFPDESIIAGIPAEQIGINSSEKL